MDSAKTIGATFTKDTADTDGDGFSNYDELVTHSTDPADITSYPTRTLTVNTTSNGAANYTATHKLGTTTTVTATAYAGFIFDQWTGDASGSDNPLSLTMDSAKTIGATFTKDTADTDGDGFSNYDELVTHSTDPTDANNYPQVALTVTDTISGNISVSGGSKLGSIATVTATPDLCLLYTSDAADE